MHRLQRLHLQQNIQEFSSDAEEENERVPQPPQDSSIARPTTTDSMPSPIVTTINSMEDRITLLPAYPSLASAKSVNLQEHLLLTNVPRHLLTAEQRRHYRDRYSFQSPFQIIDQTTSNAIGTSFFLSKYRELFSNLTRRFHINDAIVDYNYQRLLKCFHLMANERITYGLQQNLLAPEDVLPFHEHAIALEFFLQIDLNTFFMKTCSFRGALGHLSNNFDGIFCLEHPYARFEMTPCQNVYCHFCFPLASVPNRTRERQPVVQFSSSQEHMFVSGYRTILNCPATCQTKNILYALTCPCGEVDYIGYTSMTLGQRLTYHREHGNRIVHEFLLGSKNILRVQTQPKSNERLVKDEMLLYKHSARCPVAMQLFLDCNPHYWPFIPVTQEEARKENQFYRLPSTIPEDPSSLINTSHSTRSDHDTGSCMSDLPPLPSSKYTFSSRQCAEQFLYFQKKQDLQPPNFNLDLYNATIIAVLPNKCSKPLHRLVEALLITHAQTKLNTLGHLDSDAGHQMKNHLTAKTDILVDRGDWCCNLLRRPSHITT